MCLYKCFKCKTLYYYYYFNNNFFKHKYISESASKKLKALFEIFFHIFNKAQDINC